VLSRALRRLASSCCWLAMGGLRLQDKGLVGRGEKELGLAHHPWACLAAGTHVRLVNDQPGNQLSVGCGLREHYMLRATR
jgi:hypothetical protein